MIDLYCLTSPNVQKIFIMLEELELPYRQKQVDVWKSEQYDPEFAKLNPNRRIPVIVDHDGPGGSPYTVFESGAILLYLADKHGRFLPQDTRAKYDTIQWLMIQLTGVGPMFGQAHHFRKFAPEPVPYAIERYSKEARRLYGVLDKRLGEAEHLAGDYSIADMATYPWVARHEWQGVDLADFANVKRWYDAIGARPAVQRGMAVPKL